MASLVMRRRKDGTPTYRIGYLHDGKLHWTPTIEDADAAVEMKGLVERLGPDAALAILERRSGHRVSDMPLLSEWLEDHLHKLAASVTPGTVSDYRGMAARTWLPRLGPMPVNTVTRETVIDWVRWQRAQTTRRGDPYSPKSIRNAHGLLSSVLAAAVDADLVPRNVARGVDLPSDAADREMEILAGDEWAALIEAMDEHYRPLTRFLLTTGVRIGEATAVQVRDLDPARRTIQIRRAWKKGERDSRYLGATKSRRGVRTLVLGADVVDELVALTAGRPRDALIFTGRRGARIQAQHFRNRQWARALVKAGITKHITPHGLRHTSASWLLDAGVAPIVVQHRLGHESLTTTSRVYAHLMTDAQAGAVDVMASAMAPRAAPAAP